MTQPQIIMGGNEGQHNTNLDEARERIERGGAYKDVSTILVCPTRGVIPARVVESWMGLASPMNQKFLRMMIRGMEVGAAYSTAIETILEHEELSKWRYVLTLEEDNMPPPDGLLNLIESIGDFAAIGGLYWTKGEGGQPMIYGNKAEPLNFIPQPPTPDAVQECWGLGMGFTLFDLNVFRDEKLDRPFFRTVQQFDPSGMNGGSRTYSQDLEFFERIGKLGHKVACDTRVRVGHYDPATDMIW